jgi:hypothetical protein
VDNPTSGKPVPQGQAEDAFAVLVLRYLEGLATPQEVGELNTALKSRPECRDLFVQMSRLHGGLSEVLAPRRAAERKKAGPAALHVPADLPTEAAPGAVSVLTGDEGASPLPEGAAEPPSVADTLLGKLSAEDTVHGRPAAPADPDPGREQ